MEKQKKKPSNFGSGVTADVPSDDRPDAKFSFKTHFETPDLQIVLEIGDNVEAFSVKKLSFLRALRHVFPNIISQNALVAEEMRGSMPPSTGAMSQINPIQQLLNGLMGGGGGIVRLDINQPPPDEPEED